VFDISIWEFLVIGVLALVVFGPDRLPRAAADAARLLRQLRQGAAAARSELTVAAGLGEGGEMASVVADLRDLDPRRIVSEMVEPADIDPLSDPPASRTQPRSAPRTAPHPDQADPDWS
jgi:sec-independent protein translocase protein TatB